MKMPPQSKWCLLGIPDHQGVINVGGRIGAAAGPRAFRRVFQKLKGRDGVQSALLDRGDVENLTDDVSINLRRAADRVRSAHRETGLSVIVGGGHDHGYSHLLGIREAIENGSDRMTIGCINLDAHLDVRKPDPVIMSGSPFYLAVDSGVLLPENFIEFGIQRHCNAPELWRYVDRLKIKVVPFESLRNGEAPKAFEKLLKKLAAECDAVVLSFDLDSAAEAYAPGVSAPQAEGFNPSDILEIMEIAGREEKLVSLGIFELNPEHDLGDRTARLAATAAYHFVSEKLKG